MYESSWKCQDSDTTYSYIMKNLKYLTKSLLCFSLIIGCLPFSASAQIKCTIKGKVIGRTSQKILLMKATADFRSGDNFIPIIANAFETSFTAENEAYCLIFDDEVQIGELQPVVFFPVNGVIKFTLHSSENFMKNKIEGGSLNKAHEEFISKAVETFENEREALKLQITELRKNNEYESSEMMVLSQQFKNTSDSPTKNELIKQMAALRKAGTNLSVKAVLIEQKRDDLNRRLIEWGYNYIKQNLSILSYYLMWNDLKYHKENSQVVNLLRETYPLFAKRFPEHAYTTLVGNELNAFLKIKAGEKFIDFTAQDLGGKDFKMSTLIENKVVLIDLWGSWCGPCISKTRTMIPIYDQYKDKGFDIVGVAREFKNADALKNRLGKEKFSWTNLLELNDKNGIWNKYAISSSAGRMLLVDKNGVILAVDPSAKEVSAILARIL
jgi:thiol-disulfide isomerase/thioredoxin